MSSDRSTAPTLVDVFRRLKGEGQAQESEPTFSAVQLAHEVGANLPPELDQTLDASQLLGKARLARDERPPAVAGHRLGRFITLGELGRGGMGRVFEALDPELRRTVAIKVMQDQEGGSAETRLARFVAEAQITGQLAHPNIVPIHDLGVTGAGEVFFVMKRVRGRSLKQVIEDLRRVEPATLREWTRHRLLTAFEQVCHAVAYAHDRGVLHRDLKPGNIMVGDFGQVLVMDWGVARLADEVDEAIVSNQVESVVVTSTLDGMAIGTPGYMSPEQARGDFRSLDGRTDVWSLGAILYELLTLKAAYEGSSVYVLMSQVLAGPPPDLRERSVQQPVPDELAEICMRALAPEPADRHPSASALADAIEAYLEGSQRRAEAERRADEAERWWDRYRQLAEERRQVTEQERKLDAATPPWTPLADKAELLGARTRLRALELEIQDAFESIVTACEGALSHDPDHRGARSRLAAAYWDRLEAAEAEGDDGLARHYAGRVRAYDDGRYAHRLRGHGALTLHTDPPGAEVVCQRYERRGLIWALGEPTSLGRTPLESVELPMGSYLLTLRVDDERACRYPVHITRGRHWHAGDEPVPIPSSAEIGDGWIYVPPGPTIIGGDQDALNAGRRERVRLDGFFMARFPVTQAEYCAFINAVHADDPELAWRRVPRHTTGSESSSRYWARPDPGQRYEVPEQDQDGDPFDPNWPVFSVTWHDAMAFATWVSETTGVSQDLPTGREWEKAARGVDGRYFPWGDMFDATLCAMHDSRPGRPQPHAVGALSTDCSVYGVRDLSGGIREWCSDRSFLGHVTRRMVRGGSWYNNPGVCRLAHRSGAEPDFLSATFGFRLVRRAIVRSSLQRRE